ncbi:uncharacterized protein BP5553_08111 [Venustampulla echinocandica]|uniref:U-box domain-containing protein n=1 Tax=Venustampulla echinocandica TaxID=2656787 RepID=A0A370TFS1_9HELO|nr:uncharacterized protein BP5553_08111 [Venustampulla echinocandica]RDL33743.1 hypothetical protein BP5553_08111 [Venustampulla echinocandica]
MALLKLSRWSAVIEDSNHAISLLAENMKAYYYLAQAQIALHDSEFALDSAKKAHELCVKEVLIGGKGAGSLNVITELVLKCKKENWERKEKERLMARGGLLADLVGLLERERDQKQEVVHGDTSQELIREISNEYAEKIEELRHTFEAANGAHDEGRRRKVPDWVVDDITFSVMVDPVVTKTGQSYDRSSIMEHLRRSPTDPLTREPLRAEDLRPNLALRAACDEFLQENGWAVDW